MEHIAQIEQHIADWITMHLTIFILIGVGLVLTVVSRAVQLRLFPEMVRTVLGSRKGADGGISSFQAFAISLAARVGIGNVFGVAAALMFGGPGAIFWMWVVALVGMATAFFEATLAQIFKVKHSDGSYRGGPAYYIGKGLGQKWLGVLFALCLIVCFGLVYNAIQANTIVLAVQSAAGWTAEKGTSDAQWAQYQQFLAAGLVLMSAPIIFGGIRRVAKVSESFVPLMAVLYLLMALYVMAVHVERIPEMFALIFRDAFTFKAAGGGLLGSLVSQSMMLGIKRGLYSNEAGQGSAPNAAAAADVKHPVSQGMIQMLGVFVDTVIVCSCTAFIVLLAQLPAKEGLDGIQLTQAALESHVGAWGQHFLAVVLFMFAFSSIIGNYAYAESNIQFLNNNKTVLNLFRLAVLGFVYFGSVSHAQIVWDMGDLTMGVMALINLVAITLLAKWVRLLLKDYTVKVKLGKEPEFKLSEHPVLKRKIKTDIW